MRLALEDKDGNIVEIFHANKGRIDLPGVGQISPVPMGKIGHGFTVIEVTEFVVPEGKNRIGKPSHKIVRGKLVETFATEALPIRKILTTDQKIERLFTDYNISAVELKTYLERVR